MTEVTTWHVVYVGLAVIGLTFLARIAKAAEEAVRQLKALRRGDITTDVY